MLLLSTHMMGFVSSPSPSPHVPLNPKLQQSHKVTNKEKKDGFGLRAETTPLSIRQRNCAEVRIFRIGVCRSQDFQNPLSCMNLQVIIYNHFVLSQCG